MIKYNLLKQNMIQELKAMKKKKNLKIMKLKVLMNKFWNKKK